MADLPFPFTEEALPRGIDYHVQNWLSGGANGSGYGVAFADLNNNGSPDLLATGHISGLVGVWQNDGTGHFIDRSEESGIPHLWQANGFGVGDYNGNGMLDIFITRYFEQEKLFRNLGDFQFEDVTEGSGIENDWRSHDATFGDYNGDGWLDIYVANYCSPFNLCATGHNRLYENQAGSGTFIDRANELGVDDNGAGIHAFFYDFNHNGYPDIYVSNSRGHLFLFLHNRLYHNLGGTFIDISEESGTDYAAWSMGCAIGDFSLTGWQDIYCTNLGISGYFVHHGDYYFEDAVMEAGIENDGAGWGAANFDFNNNGLLDLYVVNTATPGGNKLYMNTGSFPAVEVSGAYGVSVNKNSYCFALADIQGNGALDFIHQAMDDRLRLFINHEGTLRNWIKFRVNGVAPNHFSFGAMIDIRVGDTWQHRQINGGNDYKGANHLVQHFGLNDAEVVDEVIVRWAADAPAEVVLRNVPANQTVVVDHPGKGSCLGDLTGSGSVDVFDLLLLLSAWGPCVGECPEDLNGDGIVDVFDLLTLFAGWGPCT